MVTTAMVEEPREEWGGPWTEKKLKAFQDYVVAYLTIMNRHPYWQTIYFDGFAGSGTRKEKLDNALYLALDISEEEQGGYKGAAQRLSELNEPHRFDYYYFVDKDDKAVLKLETKLRPLNEGKKGNLQFRSGDCNTALLKLAEALHQKKSPNGKALKYASLLFLDPFGMHIEWSSLERLRDTRSDVWILLPTAVIVNRLLDRKGELKASAKLSSYFGLSEQEIRSRFYMPTGQRSMFSEEEQYRKVADPINTISKLYIERLNTIWSQVTKSPLRLNNRKGAPLFHFVFASNNASALGIAKDIIKNVN